MQEEQLLSLVCVLVGMSKRMKQELTRDQEMKIKRTLNRIAKIVCR